MAPPKTFSKGKPSKTDDRVMIMVGVAHLKAYFIELIRTSSSKMLVDGLASAETLNNKTDSGEPVIRVPWSGHPNIFGAYEHWLKFRKVILSAELREKEESPKQAYMDLLLLWRFGFYLQDDVYRDMVMSRLVERLNSNQGDQAHFIASLTLAEVTHCHDMQDAQNSGLPMRKLIANAVARFATISDFLRFHGNPAYPQVFIQNVMLATALERDRRSAETQASQSRREDTIDLIRNTPGVGVTSRPNTPVSRPTTPNNTTPRSSLKQKGDSKHGEAQKKVTFDDQGFTNNECEFHLHCSHACSTHCKGARKCWREEDQ